MSGAFAWRAALRERDEFLMDEIWTMIRPIYEWLMDQAESDGS